MRDHLDEFGDAEVAVVFFDSLDRLDDYRGAHDVPDRMRLLKDPDRRAYEALDIGRGSLWKVWGPRTWIAYARLVLRGHKARPPRADSLQLGGDVVIGADQRVAYVHRPSEPDDRPPVDDLIAALG